MHIRITTFVLLYLIWKVMIMEVNDYWVCVIDGNHLMFPYTGSSQVVICWIPYVHLSLPPFPLA